MKTKFKYVALVAIALLGASCWMLKAAPDVHQLTDLGPTPPGVVPTTTVATNGYTLVSTDQLVLLTGTNTTVALPATAFGGYVNGREYIIKNLAPHGTNTVVQGAVGQVIDGQATWQLTNQYSVMHVRCDGSVWHIVSASGIAYIP